jgi:leucyl-tRNA synthetase
MIQGEDGQKMSKSRGNVINPDDVISEYGADSMRLYEMFMGPLDKSKPWSTKGLQGCARFAEKVWRVYSNTDKYSDKPDSEETIRLLHQTIAKVTNDLDNMRFNTAISQMMIFSNHLQTKDHTNTNTLKTWSRHSHQKRTEKLYKRCKTHIRQTHDNDPQRNHPSHHHSSLRTHCRH